jgi:hypothetical protein
VILSIARDAQIVDISHVVPKFAIGAGAYLLRAAVPWLPVGFHVAVVDPGVGTVRRPIGISTGRGDVLIGPDNGLLLPAAERLGGIREARLLENRGLMLPETSNTFHGRDIFAPVAAHLAMGTPFDAVGPALDLASLVELALPAVSIGTDQLETGVVYVDDFGNLRLAGGIEDLRTAFGEVAPGTELRIHHAGGEQLVRFARTFGEVAPGELLVYEDSSGDLAIGESSGDAARRLGLATGDRIGLRRP